MGERNHVLRIAGGLQTGEGAGFVARPGHDQNRCRVAAQYMAPAVTISDRPVGAAFGAHRTRSAGDGQAQTGRTPSAPLTRQLVPRPRLPRRSPPRWSGEAAASSRGRQPIDPDGRGAARVRRLRAVELDRLEQPVADGDAVVGPMQAGVAGSRSSPSIHTTGPATESLKGSAFRHCRSFACRPADCFAGGCHQRPPRGGSWPSVRSPPTRRRGPSPR